MKTNKILAVALLSSVAFSSYAKAIPENKEVRAMMDAIEKEAGLPSFNSGVQIVPRSQLALPGDLLKQGLAEIKQRETLGYAEKDDPYIAELLSMRKTAPHDIKLYASNQNDSSTHLRKSVRDLKLAFKFPGTGANGKLRYTPGMQVLGAAPQGSFDSDDGWSGAINFFAYRNIGVCAYGVMNVEASGTAAMLAMEDVTYDINDKATLIKVDGKPGYGFLYNVEWFDDINFHELTCATQEYSSEIKQSIISLAKQLDRS
jgi:hypothetical protein